MLYRFFRIVTIFVLAVAVLGAKTEAAYAVLCFDNPTSYRITFEGNFNKESSPGSLPTPHVRFTQVIWGTHNSQVEFWNPGAMASDAVEAVAEEGITFNLSNEFIANRENMARWGFFPTGRYPGGEEALSITIQLCKEAPLFTGLTMLDFSPDWFVGLSSYSLLDSQENWISSRTVNLYPYDAGTEQGSEYSLNNPPSDPYQPITSIKGKGKFSGATAPVAKMKFKLINPVNLGVRVGGKQLKTVRLTEGSRQFSVTATLGSINTSGGALSIPIQSASGTTAQAGDYTVASSISIASNAKSGATTFEVTDDSNDELTETVFLEPGSPLPEGIAAGDRIKIIIDDNDATVVSLERSDAGAIAEGGAGTKENAEFTVTLGRELVAGERIDVPLVLSGLGITAGDLENLSEKSGEGLNTGVTIAGADTLTPTVIFQGAGASAATVVLTPDDDDLTESDETLTVALGPDGSGTNGFDHGSLGTNVGGGADPHSSSKSFDVVIESEDVTIEPPKTTSPLVSISGGSSVTEGGTATFTLSASPAPKADIKVNVNVGQSGAFAQSGQTGSREVTIPTGGKASLTVTTQDDSTDESDGSIKATVTSAGQSYLVSSTAYTASVTVKDNDGLPATSDDNDGLPPSTVSDPGDSNDEPSPDRRILVAIHNTAGGEGWTRQNNWITTAPIVTWYGIVADLEGRVTGLILEDNNLEGGISGDTGGLDKLEVLYMNNNNLEGAIPLEQLGGLESLEELALWGNEGLTGTIPDELGKRADRAVLRKIKEVNGVSVLADWFTGDDAVFDYSGWMEVEVNGNDRVSGLDLSGVGVSGDITEAIWALSDIEELDLSDNPDLSGEIPLDVMNGKLEFLDISGTGVCVPQDESFEMWLESIDFTNSDSDNCGEGRIPTSEPVPVQRSESVQGESGGGCSVASGSGFKRSVPEFALSVFVLLIIFLKGRRDCSKEKTIIEDAC